MPVDLSMYQSTLQPQKTALQTMAEMAGLQNARQQNIALQNQNQQAGIDLEETQRSREILKNTQSYTDDRGNIDFNKLVPMVMSAAPKNGSAILASMSQAQQQRTAAQNAISTQSAAALDRASNAIFGLDPDKVTPELLNQTATAINKNFTDPQAQYATQKLFENAAKIVAATKPGDPMRATNFNHLAMMYKPIEAQQAINTPNAVQMGNGQQTWMQNMKPGVAGAPQYGMLPNSAVQQQLSPSTPVMQGNTPGYLGPQAGGQGPGGIQQQSGFVPAGLPVGSKENIEANVGTMNKHFESLQDSAVGNQMVQGLKGNVLSLADKAITGTESDRISYFNGLLSTLGVKATGDIKTDTDLLNKQLSQLNLSTPATSDAARALVTASRPNSHMTPAAIKDAVSQVASQIEANVAVRNHLAGYKYANNGQGDATSYQAERQNIEKLADPRIWQYIDAGPGSKEAKHMMSKLKPEDRKALIDKAGKLQQMGILK